ncbi:MAG: TonB-dependent receptor plug domain-containing protein [Alistipes sp.]|nr:TonB-dependent receptor plug domain-containing protein [Alistipes sp.]
MKRIFHILTLLLLLPCSLFAQNEWSRRTIDIDEVTVVGNRPMKEIGLQQTKLDSALLKENISLSIADVLTFNSSIFVKSYGRATLSTVAFRGTEASHTQVTWNGMRINNPMLGMVDFSMIPSYFIDDASLLHGSSSVNETGGGLGGAVKLSTKAADAEGFGLQYIQGVGSFQTFDEFLRLTYGNTHWQLSTRVAYSSSPNEYKFTNREKKENIYDEDKNIIGQYYPTTRNRSGAYKDLHILQEAYYNTGRGDRIGLSAWYINSNRELPTLTVDYGSDKAFENRQREQTFRGILSWDHLRSDWKVGAKAGYTFSWMPYDYKRDVGNGTMASMIRARNRVSTVYGQVEGEYYVGKKWLFTASLSAYQHFAQNRDKNIITTEGDSRVVGYDKARVELSGAVSAKWKPIERLGATLTLREDMFGRDHSPIIPALFVDGVLSKRGNIVAKASVSRNYRFPTLNDLYFLPGGNKDLRKESGWSYDAGLSFAIGKSQSYSLSGSATWFESRIHDWIIWLPSPMGYYKPSNIALVHSYGVELKADFAVQLGQDWRMDVNATYSWTPSIDYGENLSEADRSYGKQLVYIPLHSAAATAALKWRSWSLLYKWCYYSERYTMSSNDIMLTGKLPEYFMNNLSLEKGFSTLWADLTLKGSVNNLFDEEYMSVLSRPMPGINFEIFLGITPKWGRY